VYELVGEVIGHLSCDVQAGGRTCEASSLVQLESGFGWLNLSATADVIVEVPGVKPKSLLKGILNNWTSTYTSQVSILFCYRHLILLQTCNSAKYFTC
jgi:hypothetical protein